MLIILCLVTTGVTNIYTTKAGPTLMSFFAPIQSLMFVATISHFFSMGQVQHTYVTRLKWEALYQMLFI